MQTGPALVKQLSEMCPGYDRTNVSLPFLVVFANAVAERCAIEIAEANAYRGGHGDPGRLTDREMGDRLRVLFSPTERKD